MKKIKIFPPVLIAFSFFCCVLLNGCQETPVARQEFLRPLHVNTDILTLPNGLTLILEKKSEVPLVAISLTVRAGLITELNYTGSGISHFIEHMVFKGNKEYPQEKINSFLRGIGGSINAFTTRDYTTFSVTVPREYLKDTLAMLYAITVKPDFPEQEFTQEKQVILNELKFREDNPYDYAFKTIWALAFKSHPYHFPVIGDSYLFSNLTRDDLAHYHKMLYQPKNMALAIAGDLDPSATLPIVAQTFGGATQEPVPVSIPLGEPSRIGPFAREEILPLQNTYLIMAFKGVSYMNKDAMALDVISSVLSDGEGARLDKILKEKGLVYQYAVSDITPTAEGLFIISCILDHKKIPAVIEALNKEIDSLRRDGITPKEFEKIKNSLYSTLLRSFQNIENVASDLSGNAIMTGDPLFVHAYLKRLAEVSNDDIKTAATRYLRPENMSVLVLTPRDENSEAQTPALEQLLGIGAQEKPVGEIRKFTLPSGLTVLIKEDHSLPLVYTALVSLSGLRYETDKNNGVSALCAKVLDKGLLRNASLNIAQEAEEKGGYFNVIPGNNTMIVSLDIPSQYFDSLFGLFSDFVQDVYVPEKDMPIEKQILYAEQKNQKEDPFQYAHLYLKQLLFANYPYRLNPLGTEQSVKGLDEKALRDFMKASFNPKNSVLIIIGDVDEGKARAHVARRLKHFRTTVSYAPELAQPKPSEEKEKTLNLPKQEALILKGYQICPVKSPDRYVFDVLSSYFNGVGGKLYQSLREKYGTSYSLGAFHVLGPEKGYYVFYVHCAPDAVEGLEKDLTAIIHSLEGGIPEDALTSAKQITKTDFLLRRQSQESQALQYSLDELLGAGYNDSKDYLAHIEKISQQDIQNAAKKYFTDDAARTVKVYPQRAAAAQQEKD